MAEPNSDYKFTHTYSHAYYNLTIQKAHIIDFDNFQ